MPQRVAQPTNHIPIRIRKIHSARPPINHQMDISSQTCSPSIIHAGMLHSKFSSKLISRLTKKPPVFLLVLIDITDTQKCTGGIHLCTFLHNSIIPHFSQNSAGSTPQRNGIVTDGLFTGLHHCVAPPVILLWQYYSIGKTPFQEISLFPEYFICG